MEEINQIIEGIDCIFYIMGQKIELPYQI